MRAPRRRACSRSSRTRAPAPSANTKPSRRTSKGRDVPVSTVPSCWRRRPSPIADHGRLGAARRWPRRSGPRPRGDPPPPRAWVPAAQAVAMVSHGPCQPARMEMLAAPALAIIIGMRKGDTRAGPFSRNTPICSCNVSSPPTPVAKTTPARSGSAPISPASVSAMSAAATENWANRSTRRTSLGPNQRSGRSPAPGARPRGRAAAGPPRSPRGRCRSRPARPCR